MQIELTVIHLPVTFKVTEFSKKNKKNRRLASVFIEKYDDCIRTYNQHQYVVYCKFP